MIFGSVPKRCPRTHVIPSRGGPDGCEIEHLVLVGITSVWIDECQRARTAGKTSDIAIRWLAIGANRSFLNRFPPGEADGDSEFYLAPCRNLLDKVRVEAVFFRSLSFFLSLLFRLSVSTLYLSCLDLRFCIFLFYFLSFLFTIAKVLRRYERNERRTLYDRMNSNEILRLVSIVVI